MQYLNHWFFTWSYFGSPYKRDWPSHWGQQCLLVVVRAEQYSTGLHSQLCFGGGPSSPQNLWMHSMVTSWSHTRQCWLHKSCFSSRVESKFSFLWEQVTPFGVDFKLPSLITLCMDKKAIETTKVKGWTEKANIYDWCTDACVSILRVQTRRDMNPCSLPECHLSNAFVSLRTF